MKKTDINNMPELLAPCGGPESVEAAIRCGADAVYIGGKSFSARRSAVNFTHEELEACIRECHRNGVLVYQAINIIAFDDELNDLTDAVSSACHLGVDALIVQDLATKAIVQAACPDMPIHASTQMSIHTPHGVLAAKELGYERTVVAREMSLDGIRQVCELDTEIEAFVHGALCMCISGQCYLSGMIGSRSANRGACAGACRLPFSSKGKAGDKYALSLKDLSYAEHIEELKRAGVASLKIEGRMKRPEYVASATHTLRRALDGEDYDMNTLRAVFSRSGFTDGYLTEKLDGEMFGARTKEDVTSMGDVLPRLRELYRAPRKRFTLDLTFSAFLGEKMILTASDGEEWVTVCGDKAELARSKATSEEDIKTQLGKLGGTIYKEGQITVGMDEGLMIPLSKLNDLRRRAVSELDERRIERNTKLKSFDETKLPTLSKPKFTKKSTALRIYVESLNQLEQVNFEKVEYVTLPLELWKSYSEKGYPVEKAILAPPRFTAHEQRVEEALAEAKKGGFCRILCRNLGHIHMGRGLGLTLHGDFGLNISNSLAMREYEKLGLRDTILSYELKASELSRIDAHIPVGYIGYGSLPLMLLANCPIRGEVGCKDCTGRLIDRTGASFKVLCHKSLGYYELLNSATLQLADKQADFNADFITLYFTDESPDRVARVIQDYTHGKKPTGEFTRGLYYRGVE